MLVELFPRANARYAGMPILGSYLEGFLEWLRTQGHPPVTMRRRVVAAGRLDVLLQRRHVREVRDLTKGDLLDCLPVRTKKNVDFSACIRSLTAFFTHLGILAPSTSTAKQILLNAYRAHLECTRGLAPRTVHHHTSTATEFLGVVGLSRLRRIGVRELEDFMRRLARRRSRASLQHTAAHLRSFLRFLASRGRVPVGLNNQVDTPRIYRGERLPRAVPWKTVLAFLDAIDRSSVKGRRDYAMFLLIATYGLRASEIVALSLDDLDWRGRTIRVPRPKVGRPIVLPLTQEVGAALVAYLQNGRPHLAHRHVFLRNRVPNGALKPTAVTEAFQAWNHHKCLPIPFHGPHCLRHSLAMHLLRQGCTIKTIGDLLGHRSAESTCVYLRLNADELRHVALNLPSARRKGGRS